MDFKLKLLGSALLACVILHACKGGGKKEKGNKNAGGGPVVVDVSVAKLQEHTYDVEANGTVLASEFVELKPEMSGRIVMLNIQEGKPVQEGTLLVKLYDEDLQAQLKKYNAQMDLAKKTEQRLKPLLAVNGINQAEYDQALTQIDNIRADIDYTRAQIRKTEIKAPFNGTIGLRMVSKGAYVSQQDILATLQQISMLKIDFVLPESHASEIKVGDAVSVEGDDGQKRPAHVIALEPQINTSTRNIKVRAMLDGHSAGLNPGSFVKVLMERGQGKKTILVPSNCIIPETRDKKIALIKQGKVKMTKVETGYRGQDDIEIVSGISPGDTFAINGIMFLKPDAQVKIRQVK